MDPFVHLPLSPVAMSAYTGHWILMHCVRSVLLAPLTAIALVVLVLLPQQVSAAADFSDNSSAALTTKAWDAANANADDALAYANECIRLYEGEALKMQARLERKANETKEETSGRWALNDVGACFFIKGNVLLQKKDMKGAIEAYTKLVKQLPDAQCWDPKGWFWGPATAAKQKLVELELDAE
jgi:tetratricopeptide (TPR) repeat protein